MVVKRTLQAARQPQSPTRRSVLHGAGQHPPPRRRLSASPRVSPVSIRRLREAARQRSDSTRQSARGDERDVRRRHADDQGDHRVSAGARPQHRILRSSGRRDVVPGGDDREGPLQGRRTGVSIRLHVRGHLEGAGAGNSFRAGDRQTRRGSPGAAGCRAPSGACTDRTGSRAFGTSSGGESRSGGDDRPGNDRGDSEGHAGRQRAGQRSGAEGRFRGHMGPRVPDARSRDRARGPARAV